MSLSRYKEMQIIRNVDKDYKLVFASRFSYNGIAQYNTENLRYPTEEERRTMNFQEETWGYGSRLFKYAKKYYGDPSYWWIIAWYNKIGIESEIQIGQKIYIPSSLDYILTTYGL